MHYRHRDNNNQIRMVEREKMEMRDGKQKENQKTKNKNIQQ
jgi:hypothetical protein